MGITDKASGKLKQAAGDITDDDSMHREGQREEEKGEKKEELDRAEAESEAKADEVSDLERKT